MADDDSNVPSPPITMRINLGYSDVDEGEASDDASSLKCTSDAPALYDHDDTSLQRISTNISSSLLLSSPDRPADSSPPTLRDDGLFQSDGQPPTMYLNASPIQRRVRSPPSTSQNLLDASSLRPIPMRRVSSTPTSVNRRKPLVPAAPNQLPKRSSDRPPLSQGRRIAIQAQRRSSTSLTATSRNLSLRAGYHLRRHISLPTAGHTPTDDDSLSSTEEEIAELVPREWATPTRNKEGRNIFRTTGNTGTPDGDALKSGKSTFGTEILQRVNTGETLNDEVTDVFEPAMCQIGASDNISGYDEFGIAARRRVGTISPSSASSDKSSSTRDLEPLLNQRHGLHFAVYLSTFACFGTIIRVFMGRLFGRDCEFQDVQDWLTPFSKHICVTASGLTGQTGGALFTDLPANMLGSFLMGLLSGVGGAGLPIPWLAPNHPFQTHTTLHVAIRTGMCGSLTTFASWNAQMVVMLDGTMTELGSQIATALAGYMFGLMSAIACFEFGSRCSVLLNHWKCRNSDHTTIEMGDERLSARSGGEENVALQALGGTKTIAFVILAMLMGSFVIGDLLFQIRFYRLLWLEVILTPPGALLRWGLALKLNSTGGPYVLGWAPWGTFAANILGSCLALFLLAIDHRFIGSYSSWLQAVMEGLRVGFAGSFSTVSTLTKEVVELNNFYAHSLKGMLYGTTTVVVAMVLGLACYSPIVRS